MNSSTPTVDMPCTVCWMTDRKAATVIYVSPASHKVVVQEDKATRTDSNGMSESQTYTYERDANGAIHEFALQGDGSYRSILKGKRLMSGVRDSYHDYSF